MAEELTYEKGCDTLAAMVAWDSDGLSPEQRAHTADCLQRVQTAIDDLTHLRANNACLHNELAGLRVEHKKQIARDQGARLPTSQEYLVARNFVNRVRWMGDAGEVAAAQVCLREPS